MTINTIEVTKTASTKNWCGLLILGLILSACDWVDSTGVQTDAGNVLIFDQTLANQSSENVRSQPLLEFALHTLSSIDPENTAGSIAGWNWGSPYQSGALPKCAQYDGFDLGISATTLSGACSNPSQCELGFNQRQQNNSTVFDILVPELRAPVGLSYQLKALSSSGESTASLITLCLISVNEAPIARNDQFSIAQGTPLVVAANSTRHLLSNDEDDIDVRNLPLRVNPIPVRAPDHASQFSLGTDGSFTYTPNAGARILNDSFVYQITDGQHSANATVELRFVSTNNPPLLVARIPTLEILVNRDLDTDDAKYNLAAYFRDPDGNLLEYSVRDNSLPASRNLTLSSRGRLTGKPTLEDIGDYRVTVVASDGELSTAETFTLSVVQTSASANSPPTIKQLSDIGVALGAPINISLDAQDDDDDVLSFSLSNSAPDFLSIDPQSGDISGLATTEGIYSITVFASDRKTLTSMTFGLEISEHANRPPQVEDIKNRRVSGNFTYNVSVFFRDPDGDELHFTSDRLPSDLTLSAQGILTGTETSANRGDHIITITAEDSFGGSVSDRFRLTIN